MAQQTTTWQTTIPSEEVLVQAVQFFTKENWRVQTQSARAATFMRKARRPWWQISVGLGFLIYGIVAISVYLEAMTWGVMDRESMIQSIAITVVGVIFLIWAQRRWRRSRMGSGDIAVTVTPFKEGTDVNLTYTKEAKKLVSRFLDNLPK